MAEHAGSKERKKRAVVVGREGWAERRAAAVRILRDGFVLNGIGRGVCAKADSTKKTSDDVTRQFLAT